MSAMRNAIEKFELTLANCYWWQRLKNPASPWDLATAQSHIHPDGLPPPDPGPDHTLQQLQELRPFCLCWLDLAAGFRMARESTGSCVKTAGTIIAQIEYDVPDGLATPEAVALDAHEKIGRIIRTGNASEPGLFELTAPGYLVVNEIQSFGYARSEDKDAGTLGDAIVAELQISFGTL